MFKSLKKVWGVVLYIIIIILFAFSCMSLKTHIPTGYQKANVENIEQTKIQKKFEIGGRNFVFLLKEVQPILPGICQKSPEFCQPQIGSSASGLVLSYDSSSIFVLTAAHFCASDDNESISFKETIYGFAGDEPRPLFTLTMDIENDLCLLMGPRYKSDKFHKIKLAESFTPGEDVYTVAAPLGIAGPEMRLIFEGSLGGCSEKGCVSTIPATFGSSGGGIYNKKGELISIVMAVPEEFSHVTLSPSNDALLKFIKDIDSEIDIYKH